MKKIALFSLVLALGLTIVPPLQADMITYTIQGDFVTNPQNTSDPWGLGSGSGTMVFGFTLDTSSPPISTNLLSDAAVANYNGVGLSLTISGTTNANGTYTNLLNVSSGIWNAFTGATRSDYFSDNVALQVAGYLYNISNLAYLPQAFWSDSEVPPLPKLLSTSDILSSQGHIVGVSSTVPIYDFSSLEVTSQIVPLPPAVWLLGSGLLGLGAWRRYRKG